MKKPLLVICFLLSITMTFAQQKNIDINRTQIWGNFVYKAKVTKHFGVFARYSSRYNVKLDKFVNDSPASMDPQKSWLNEIFVGPSYSTKFGDKMTLFSSPQYRPMHWHASETNDTKNYLQHTLHWNNTLNYKIKKVQLTYRLIFWNRFKLDEFNLENKTLTRHYLGLTVPIGKKLKLSVGNEIFLLHNPSDKEQTFFRNAIWSYGTYKTPVKGISMKLGYLNWLTFKENSTAIKKNITDHYVYFALIYKKDYSKKAPVTKK